MFTAAVLLALVSLAVPNRFIHLEPVSVGVLYDGTSPDFTTPRMFAARLLKFSCSLGRVRFGFAPVEAGAFMGSGDHPTGAGGFLPVYAGFDVYRNPKKTLLCYSMVPDVYIEGTWVPVLQVPGGTMLRLAAVGEIEYYGLGLGLEAGYLTADEQDVGRVHIFGAGFRLRLMTGNFGF